MKIQVHFYAQLRDIAGVSELSVKVPQASSVADVLEKLYQSKPMLRAHDKNILIGSGVDFVARNHVLSEDEELAIMPPVQGG